MNRRFLVLALLIAGLVWFAPMALASVSPDPDNAAGIDLHSNTVVNGLVTGTSDITSGNTVQVGPVGGTYRGAVSVEQAAGTIAVNGVTQIYTGACVLEGVNFNAAADDEYIEIYDGTARGNNSNCILDVQVADASGSNFVSIPVEMTTGIAAYISGGGVAQVYYRTEDQGE